MTQRRGQRAGVEDLWWTKDRSTGDRIKTKRYGRGKQWRVAWVDHTGKRNTRSFDLKREAQAYADELKAGLTTGAYRDPKKAHTTVGASLERHLAALAGEVKADTLREYRRIADFRLLPVWGDWPLSNVRLSEVQAWVGELKAEGLGESSLRSHALLLRAALTTAVRDRYIVENPLEHLKLPTVSNAREGKPFTMGELQRLVTWMPTDVDKAFTLVMGRCGLRPGEAMALQVKSVNLERSEILVSRRYTERGGQLSADTPKSGKNRRVPVARDVAVALEPLLKDKLPEADLFAGARGGTIRLSNWRTRKFEKALTALGFPGDHVVYDLRHTFASLVVQANGNVKTLQTVMGHADISTTMRHYAHLFPDDLDRLRTVLNETADYPLTTGAVSGSPALRAVGD